MTRSGDINQDGKIDTQDLDFIRSLLSEGNIPDDVFKSLPPHQQALLDVNGDGSFNREDLVSLCQKLLGQEHSSSLNQSHQSRLASLRTKYQTP